MGTGRQDRRHRPDRAHPGRTRRPTRACSITCASSSLKVPEAKLRGYQQGRFSFNVRGGRASTAPATVRSRSRCTSSPTCTSVRGLQGQAVQPRDARGAVQGPVDRRRARDERRRGARVLPAHPDQRHMQTLSVGAGYVRLGQPAPTCRAARPSASSSAPSSTSGRPATRCTCSTSRPPACTSRTCESCWRFQRLVDRQHRARDRAQPRRDQDRRLADRPRPRARTRRQGRRHARPSPLPSNPCPTGRFLAEALERPQLPLETTDSLVPQGDPAALHRGRCCCIPADVTTRLVVLCPGLSVAACALDRRAGSQR